jgi:hypothetical protein
MAAFMLAVGVYLVVLAFETTPQYRGGGKMTRGAALVARVLRLLGGIFCPHRNLTYLRPKTLLELSVRRQQ